MRASLSNNITTFIKHLYDATKSGEIKWESHDNMSFAAELDDVRIKLSNISNIDGKYITLTGVVKNSTTSFDTFQYPQSTIQYKTIEEIYACCVDMQINRTFFTALKNMEPKSDDAKQ